MDVLWPQWILASLGPSAQTSNVYQDDMDQQNMPVDTFQRVAEICLREGYIATLHESMLIFMPVSIGLLLKKMFAYTLHEMMPAKIPNNITPTADCV